MLNRLPTVRPSRPRDGAAVSAILPQARQSAERAIDACKLVSRRCDRLIEEIDEVTAPHGIPVTGLDEEDSLVVAIASIRSAGAART